MVSSLLNQTYKNWELIFVDDGSLDDSAQAIQHYSAEKRIKDFYLPKNTGAGYAGKTAFDKSSGILLGRLDSDDALYSNAIETMVHAHLNNPTASLITSYFTPCDEQLRPGVENWSPYSPIPTGSCILKSPTVGAFATFKRKSILQTEGFNSTLSRAVDLDLYLKLEEVGDVITLPQELYLYRRNQAGISQGTNGNLAKADAYLVQQRAFKRRLSNGFGCNWTRREAATAMLRRHQIRILNSPELNPIKSALEAIKEHPELAMTTTIYRNTLSALWKRIRSK